VFENVLRVVALAGSGLTAGVLLAVAISVVPALGAVPPAVYVRFNQLLGRNWDPTMPVIVLSSALSSALLAALVDGDRTRVMLGVGAALLVGVSGVSHLLNVPLNRQIKGLDPDALPANWQDPRAVWRRWHLLRTGLAISALLVNVVAVVV
jgi:uncharacterized membrane protein